MTGTKNVQISEKNGIHTSRIGSELWWRDSTNLPWQSWRKFNAHLKNGCIQIVNAHRTRVEESLHKWLHKGPFI